MQNFEQLFQELEIKDPKIKISNDIINLSPNYWNFSFLSTFFPILIAIYVYTVLRSKLNDEINLLFLISFILLPIVLLTQLKYYNVIKINFSNKTILITPNLLLRLFVRKKNISFKDVKRFETMSNVSLEIRHVV
jgi:cytochrome c biogenesis factor